MHPFEHRPDTPIIDGNRDNWLKCIHAQYLDVVTDKTVLEIASNNGDIGREILKHNPRHLTMIDPDPASQQLTGTTFVCDDVFKWLPKSSSHNVVVCFGLFYHLHNALHLLELIVNYCQPRYLILDCVIAPHPFGFIKESINMSGSRWVTGEWKTAPFNLNTPFHIFNESLHHMDYDLIKTHKIFCDFFSKSNHWVAQWRAR